MQRTDKEEEGIMGTAFRILFALSVLVLAVAACCTPCPPIIKKEPVSTVKQAVVIAIDPETGSVVSVQDNSGNIMNPATSGPNKVGTLTTSKTPVTITVELLPAGDTPPGTVGGCRIIIVNGVQYCR